MIRQDRGRGKVRPLAALGCAALAGATGSPYWLALAHLGFLINLFNLVPFPPLDGSHIAAVFSPVRFDDTRRADDQSWLPASNPIHFSHGAQQRKNGIGVRHQSLRVCARRAIRCCVALFRDN